MALPANISTRWVEGQFLTNVNDGPDPDQRPDGVPAQGVVTFVAAVPYLPDATAEPNPATLLMIPRVAVLDEAGYICTPVRGTLTPAYRGIMLECTDDPDGSVTGWTWNVKYAFKPIDGVTPIIDSHSFPLPMAEEALDLTTVVKVPSSVGIGKEQAEVLAASAQAAAQSAALNVVDALAAARSAQESARAAAADLIELGANTAEAVEREIVTTGTPARSAVELVAGQAAMEAAASKLDRDEATDTYAVKPDGGGKPVGKGEIVLNVRDFGAVGDGVTNDTAAFQRALDAARDAGGATVYVPHPGQGKEYRVGGRLSIYANTYFKSEPGAVMRRIGASFGLTNMPVDGSNHLGNLSDPYSGYGGITVDGGIWEGYAPDSGLSNNGYGAGFNCFVWTVCRNIVMQNVTVRNIATNHALDVNAVDGLLVDNCQFLGYADHSAKKDHFYTEAIQIGPFVEDSPTHPYSSFARYANGTATRNVILRGCRFGPSSELPSWPAALGNHTAQNASRGFLTGNITIQENRFEGCTFVALPLYTYDDVQVHRNTFTGCESGIKATNLGSGRIWNTATLSWDTAPARQRCRNHTYAHNTFINTAAADIQVLGTDAPSSGGTWEVIDTVKVLHNTMTRTLPGRSAGANVRVMLCANVEVTGNSGGKSTVAIAVDGSVGVAVTGNTVDGTDSYGIRVSNLGAPAGQPAGYTSDADVSGNAVKNAGTHGIGILSVHRFSMLNNTVLNHARVGSGTGVLATAGNTGLISGNKVLCTSIPFDSNGLAGTNTVNLRTTPDNLVEGVTTRVVNLTTGAGSTYGNIQY